MSPTTPCAKVQLVRGPNFCGSATSPKLPFWKGRAAARHIAPKLQRIIRVGPNAEGKKIGPRRTAADRLEPRRWRAPPEVSRLLGRDFSSLSVPRVFARNFLVCRVLATSPRKPKTADLFRFFFGFLGEVASTRPAASISGNSKYLGQ